MSYATLLLEITGEIGTLTLNRPEKRNAISTQMIEDLLGALGEAERSPARAVIVTGAGKAFCSGMDLDTLSAIAKQSPEQNLADSRRMARMFRALWTFPKPLIAAVNGAAIAGGCGIATLCDFTLAVPDAKFGSPASRGPSACCVIPRRPRWTLTSSAPSRKTPGSAPHAIFRKALLRFSKSANRSGAETSHERRTHG